MVLTRTMEARLLKQKNGYILFLRRMVLHCIRFSFSKLLFIQYFSKSNSAQCWSIRIARSLLLWLYTSISFSKVLKGKSVAELTSKSLTELQVKYTCFTYHIAWRMCLQRKKEKKQQQISMIEGLPVETSAIRQIWSVVISCIYEKAAIELDVMFAYLHRKNVCVYHFKE